MEADELIRLFSSVEVLKSEVESLKKEINYKHERAIKDIEIVHKRIGKAEDEINKRIDLIRQILDKKYINGNGNGVRNNFNGWSDKKRATIGGGVGIGVIIAVIELFKVYKGF